jgi:hypothetical protein
MYFLMHLRQGNYRKTQVPGKAHDSLFTITLFINIDLLNFYVSCVTLN